MNQSKIQSGVLDKSSSMLNFLKGEKILNELTKGVQSMKYVYPSILQKQAIPAFKDKKHANVIVRYREFTGIKVTVLLPLLNA